MFCGSILIFENILYTKTFSILNFKLIERDEVIYILFSGPATPQDCLTFEKGIGLITILSLKKFLMKC